MGPKILVWDCETAPLLGYCWGLWDNNVALNQIHTDWYILSWAAKWYGKKKIFYQDSRGKRNIEDDKHLLKGIWKLLDESDIVITHNGIKFDAKKLNARFILQGFKPPSPYKHIDTLRIAKSKFAFTSNKLEYIAKALGVAEKSNHEKYTGFELWRECMNGNSSAFSEMEKYNKQDVITLEQVYNKLAPWDNSINLSLYYDRESHVCSCGSEKVKRKGYAFTAVSKYQRYMCLKCGKQWRDSKNLFNSDKRASILRRV